jgi:hypothetical protein
VDLSFLPDKPIRGKQDLSFLPDQPGQVPTTDTSVFDFVTDPKYQEKVSNSIVYHNLLNIDPEEAFVFHDEVNKKLTEKINNEDNITKKKSGGVGRSFAPEYGKALQAGWDTSVLGLMKNQRLNEFEAVTTTEKLLQGITQLAGDLPAMVAGGMIGAASAPPSPATPVFAFGGAFALPAGIRQTYMDKLKKGEVSNFEDFTDRLGNAVRETVKGEIVGGLTGIANVAAPIGWKAASEIATMTAAGSLINGEIPSVEDFFLATVTIGGLHLSTKAARVANDRLHSFYEKYNVRPESVAETLKEELGDKVTPEKINAAFDKLERESTEYYEQLKSAGLLEGLEERLFTEQMKAAGWLKSTGKTQRNAIHKLAVLEMKKNEMLAKEEIPVGAKPEPPIPLTQEQIDLFNTISKKPFEEITQEEGTRLLNNLEMLIENQGKAVVETPERFAQRGAELDAKLRATLESQGEGILKPMPERQPGTEIFAEEIVMPEEAKSILRFFAEKLGEEKGAVAVEKDSEVFKMVSGLIDQAKSAGVEIDTFLRKNGFDDATINRISEYAKAMGGQKKEKEVTLGDGIVKHRNLGTKKNPLYAPEVAIGDYNELRNMPEVRSKPLRGWTENPLYTFGELGSWAKEFFYRPYLEAEKATRTEMKSLVEEQDKILKGVSLRSLDNIGNYAIAQQAKGKGLLKISGKKEVTKLTPKEKEVYQWMRGKLEDAYSRLQLAREASGKEGFGKVDNYFTFFHEMSFLEQLGWDIVKADKNKLMDTLEIHRKTTPFRFAKMRDKGLYEVDTDAKRIFSRYMKSAVDHINMSPVIAKGREMLGTFNVEGEKYKLSNDKPNASIFLTEWLDTIAGQKPKTAIPALIEKGLTLLNRNIAFAVLSANIRSALIQPTALVNTTAEIGVKYTAEGVWDLFKEGKGGAVDKSNVLLSREFDINVTEAMNHIAGAFARPKELIGEYGMKPLQWLDMYTATATWLGAYKKAIEFEKLPEKEARNYADDVVTKTQGSAMKGDVAPIQRTALGKAMTLFQTFVINNWNFLTHEVIGIKNAEITNKVAFEKSLRWIAAATLANIFYEDVLNVNSPLPNPLTAYRESKDNGESDVSAALASMLETATIMPMLGGLRYGQSPYGATLEFGLDLGAKLKQEIGTQTGMTKPYGELLGKALGVPGTSQIIKTKRGLEEGQTLPEALLGVKKEK